MLKTGADGFDIGAMSTAPYLKAFISEERLRRIVPIVKAICSKFDLPVSADTQRHADAEAAVAGVATAINDISGGADSRLFDVAAKYKMSLIILPRDSDKVADPIASTITSLKDP
jgi:dihydropteroate synthase